MKGLHRILLCVGFVFTTFTDVHARIPGKWYVNLNGGMSFTGITSKGTPFTGKTFTLGVGYSPMPDADVGLMITTGFQISSYRHCFDRYVFVEHIQKGFGSDITAYVPLGTHVRFTTGIHFFIPIRSAIDMGQKDYNNTYYYSNDSLMSRYHRTPLSASVVAGIQFLFGKNKQAIIGLRFEQAGISPVKDDAVYRDANNETITISNQMKPACAQLSFLYVIGKREKSPE